MEAQNNLIHVGSTLKQTMLYVFRNLFAYKYEWNAVFWHEVKWSGIGLLDSIRFVIQLFVPSFIFG